MYEVIKIYFKMVIYQDNQKKVIEFHDIGKRYQKNRKTYHLFHEPLFDENKYNNISIICDNNEIVIIRSGNIKMNQHYKINEYTIGRYENEYMTSQITTYTHEYIYSKDNIFLNYDIILENEVIGNYQLEIQIKGEENCE